MPRRTRATPTATVVDPLPAPDLPLGNEGLPVEYVPIASLHPHPRNYQTHPDDQLAHIAASIQQHGFYRNIVIAEDSTILAGHGVVQAATRLGYNRVPVRRLPLAPDSPEALQVLVGDNEMMRLAFKDDRQLTEMLKELNAMDPAYLLGTGFDTTMLAGLVYSTRPAGEIHDKNAANEWVGLPAYTPTDANNTDPCKLVVTFRSFEDRQEFLAHSLLAEVELNPQTHTMMSWWPPQPRDDTSSVIFD